MTSGTKGNASPGGTLGELQGFLKTVAARCPKNPDLVLPVPPSDNRRLMPSCHGRRLVLTPEARHYITSISLLRKKPSPESGYLVMLYKCYFPTARRDSGNCMKILKDALFEEDKRVLGWELPPEHGAKNLEHAQGEVHVWFVDT